MVGELAASFATPSSAVARYADDGFVRVRGLFSPTTLVPFVPVLSSVAERSRLAETPMHRRTVYERAFLQEMNLWQRVAELRALTFSTRLAQVAADLMGVDGVRLYHDQGLIKEPRGGPTPWHCDQYYWPVDTDRTITAWIPLHDVPIDMGPLEFSVGSHRVDLGRELEIGEASDSHVRRHPQWRALPRSGEAMVAGDVSFHSGWTFHGAGPNGTASHRLVFTVIYVADGARLAAPRTQGQRADRAMWIPDTDVGAPIASWLNPLVWHRDGSRIDVSALPDVDRRVGAMLVS